MDVSTRFCRGCGDPLTAENWYPSLQKTYQKVCKQCFVNKLPQLYCTSCGVAIDNGRCLACNPEKEDRCAKCEVLLTDDNWTPSFKKRKVRRCKKCHLDVCNDWELRNPGHATKRSQDWRVRNPNHAKEYYHANVEHLSKVAVEYLWKCKKAAIEKLGGRCIVCGITDLRVLDINHLNGRENDKGKFGMDMYKIINDGTRALDDLDVRCCNHNRLYEYECGRRSVPTWFVSDDATVSEQEVS